jgi:excinuclease ABC subunit B
MANFKLTTDFVPRGDQPKAIAELCDGIDTGRRRQVLMGVTGSGKTFTVANVIAHYGRPALVISHNKTLAAQLYSEFREFFGESAVEYFVSYYDYYQPEAYIPQRDIYIEKETAINEELDRLRLAATSALLTRQDVIIVASVSCIYGLGSPQDYSDMTVPLAEGATVNRDEMLRKFVDLQYDRSDIDFRRGTFRVRGDTVEVFPAYEEVGYRIAFFGETIDRIDRIEPFTGRPIERVATLQVFAAKHFVMPEERIHGAIDGIRAELEHRLMELRGQGKLLEAARLEARTKYDIEMMLEMGYCPGIENYSRHLAGRAPGERPYTLIDYFPKDFLCVVDESHVTIPQIRGMHAGDRSRKTTLVEHGFRLPSALDNRPLTFDEWEKILGPVLFISATPGPYELEKTGGVVVEQVIRPTGLVDPRIRVEPAADQVEHLLGEIRKRIEAKERILVTTLTKRLAEELSEYIKEAGIKCHYLHSEIDTLERVEILRDLRAGKFDVVVGINLLREGLDLPEVSLVAILDADKEGFLRSETALIQTIGRTARNVNAEVILYADVVTDSMKRAMDETNRRRTIQEAYNRENNITPETVKKAIRQGITEEIAARRVVAKVYGGDDENLDVEEMVNALETEMYKAAGRLDFEEAARLRDEILRLKPERSAIIMTPKKRKAEALAREKRYKREATKKYRNFDRRRKTSG